MKINMPRNCLKSVKGIKTFQMRMKIKVTRRERLTSALYLRLKKRKTVFFGKKLAIFEKKIRKMSYSAEKNQKGTL